ncbi:Radical S-adenosyl methionine domain-containing protein 1, mitochondrial [Lamellibrachia satsuma]|nr:Radical S-adenosyl methionine domain-containing protein 1, mitochondrial [Lamellibrachia satsuma]
MTKFARWIPYDLRLLGGISSFPARLTNTSVSAKDVDEASWQREAVLYVHWPYCERRCTYCNFNKYVSDAVDHKRMRDCLCTELCTLLSLGHVRRIKSIFFGGGTPSLAEPETLHKVIKTVADRVDLQSDAEITIEVNPNSTEAAKLRAFRDAGINRVSLGVQALNDNDLHILGRQHTVEEALRTLDMCKKLFHGRTSVDVIFGRPGQTLSVWQDELQQILNLCDDHISLYQLTLERGTSLFKDVMDRKLFMPPANKMADMYDAAVQVTEDAGFSRYEASNFARNNAESSHNQAYWQGTQYIGIGPGAHGRFVPLGDGKAVREARIQTLEPEPWMYEVEKYGHATRRAVPQSQLDILQEILMLGLRTKIGIPSERWLRFSCGPTLQEVFSNTYMVQLLQKEGFLVLGDRGLRTTSRGLNVVDSIVPELLNVLNKYFELSPQKTTNHLLGLGATKTSRAEQSQRGRPRSHIASQTPYEYNRGNNAVHRSSSWQRTHMSVIEGSPCTKKEFQQKKKLKACHRQWKKTLLIP